MYISCLVYQESNSLIYEFVIIIKMRTNGNLTLKIQGWYMSIYYLFCDRCLWTLIGEMDTVLSALWTGANFP